MDAHKEIHFEDFIVDYLGSHGWLVGDAAHYDRLRALYPEDLIGYLQDSQPDAWKKLSTLNGPATDKLVLDRVVKTLEGEGTLEVLRRGVKVAGGGTLILCQAVPEDERNEAVIRRYQQNRLRVVRQLRYAPDRDWSIDLVFFINGIPVATAELKSDFTQSVDHAIQQYREDRQPKDAASGRTHPLLRFKRGALVHFAISTTEIYMATELQGAKTYFLPFNLGHNEGAGNPPAAEGTYAVAYLWERILAPDNWLKIFHRFMLLERKDKQHADGKPYSDETLIFPRFHQWEAVTLMMQAVREEGAGQRYLIQHSAGSGKTYTLSWLCHELIRLRSEQGEKYFDSVIVVTDRTVLDAQLQDAIQQIDHQLGVVRAIDRESSPLPKSQQLAEALLARTPIIVVTLQTFPHAMEAILSETSLKDRRYAVIVDEAHTSQTGSTASKLRAVLALDKDEDMAAMTAEEILERLQQVRQFPTNVSYFAFTATPKHSTLTLFGRPKDPSQPVSKDNPPAPFHVYTMQQAIEENFILDVLRNYTAYRTAFKLGEALQDDQRVDSKQARRALAKWLSLHPTNVAQKVEFIVEHFRDNVAPLLNGQAKAMIVTGSRAAAVKYKLELDRCVQEHGYAIRALVAFSGKVRGEDVDHALAGEEFTETNMNPETKGQDLRHALETNDYRLMLVANKFQTGFDQPKLVAMYLDKRISGVEAVQTLSRLNRTYPGKDRTYVIDFANDPEEILGAFRLFYREARIEDAQDPNVVYDLKQQLDKAFIYTPEEVRQFGAEISRREPRQTKLFAITDPATQRFNGQLNKLNDGIARYEETFQRCHAVGDTGGAAQADAKRSELTTERDGLMRFKEGLGKFVRVYEYIAQLIDFGDAELEAFACFARLLRQRLNSINPEEIDLKGLQLTHYRIKDKGELQGVAEPGAALEDSEQRPIKGQIGDPRDRERAFLSELVEKLNALFGVEITDQDKVMFAVHITEKLRTNDAVMAQVQINPKEQALKGDLPDAATEAIIEAMTSHSDMTNRLLSDATTMTAFVGLLYDLLNKASNASLLSGGKAQ